ncbi:MAG: hypothetical protein HUU50_06540 [Candidatus Brocadiae bacterium]|nr:hypothetical protein [Candidatus Brocadiia bacterium]
MKNNYLKWFFFFFLFIAILGCSGTQNSVNPISPKESSFASPETIKVSPQYSPDVAKVESHAVVESKPTNAYKPKIMIFVTEPFPSKKALDYFYQKIHKKLLPHCKIYDREKSQEIMKQEFRSLSHTQEDLENFFLFRMASWDAILYLSLEIDSVQELAESKSKKARAKGRLVRVQDGREIGNFVEYDAKGIIDWYSDAEEKSIDNIVPAFWENLLEKIQNFPQRPANLVRLNASFSREKDKKTFYDELERLSSEYYRIAGNPIMVQNGFGINLELTKLKTMEIANLLKEACEANALPVDIQCADHLILVQSGNKKFLLDE